MFYNYNVYVITSLGNILIIRNDIKRELSRECTFCIGKINHLINEISNKNFDREINKQSEE